MNEKEQKPEATEKAPLIKASYLRSVTEDIAVKELHNIKEEMVRKLWKLANKEELKPNFIKK